jgi:hypothetical protein
VSSVNIKYNRSGGDNQVLIDGIDITDKVSEISVDINATGLPKVTLSIIATELEITMDEVGVGQWDKGKLNISD